MNRLFLVMTIAATAWMFGAGARAEGDKGFTVSSTPNGLITVPACQDQFADLPQLAVRLGVEPLDDAASSTGSPVFRMCDGRRYNVNALINAFLDRADAAEKHISEALK